MVREEVDTCQRAHLQSKYTTIDSINREEVQHVVCASGWSSVNELWHITMLGMNVPLNWSTVSQESINHSNSYKDITGDIKRQGSDIDVLDEQQLESAAPHHHPKRRARKWAPAKAMCSRLYADLWTTTSKGMCAISAHPCIPTTEDEDITSLISDQVAGGSQNVPIPKPCENRWN